MTLQYTRKRLTTATADAVPHQEPLRPIVKVDEAEQIVWGIVLEPNVVDLQGDEVSPEEVTKAAHGYMTHHRRRGLMHTYALDAHTELVESFVAPSDFDLDGRLIKAGTWLMGVRMLRDDLWKAVLDCKINGFSVGGNGRRKEVK